MTDERAITHDFLTSVLKYDEVTGEFSWLDTRNNAVKCGAKAGYTRSDGYQVIVLKQHLFLGHRVAWFYVHGEWPSDFIDHIDGNPANNSIANLRPATRSQNMMNMPTPPCNTSGCKGVSKTRGRNKWEAYITFQRKRKRLGYFDNREQAIAARLAAEAKLFGEYARPTLAALRAQARGQGK